MVKNPESIDINFQNINHQKIKHQSINRQIINHQSNNHQGNNHKSIFLQNIDLIGLADKAIFYFREQQYDKALKTVAETIDPINNLVEAIISDRQYFKLVSTESIIEMLTGIVDAKKNQDYILLADLYEMQLVNFLCSIQELIISKEEFDYNQDNYNSNLKLLLKKNTLLSDTMPEIMNPSSLLAQGYRVEFSSCGLMTVGVENEGSKFYLHTNNRITNESFLLAKRWHKDNQKNYIIYGLGFGYHINELRELTPESRIEIYESDGHILHLACAFANIKTILEDPKVTILYDPDCNLIQQRLQEIKPEEKLEIHYPSLKNLKEKQAKKMLENHIPWSKILENC